MTHRPRPVHYRTILEVLNTRPVQFVIGLVFTILGIAMTILFTTLFTTVDSDIPQVDYAQVIERGQPTTATITALTEQTNVTINNVHPTIISYHYSAYGRQVESKFKTLSPDQVSTLKVGDTVPIKYLDTASVITSLEPFAFPTWVFSIFPLIFVVVGLPFVIYLYVFARGQIHLYQYGTVAQAQVVSMTHKTVRTKPRRSQVEIHYQYKAHNGQPLLGSALSSDMTLLNTLKQGDPLKIFVSPEDQTRSTLVPHLEAVRNAWKID